MAVVVRIESESDQTDPRDEVLNNWLIAIALAVAIFPEGRPGRATECSRLEWEGMFAAMQVVSPILPRSN